MSDVTLIEVKEYEQAQRILFNEPPDINIY